MYEVVQNLIKFKTDLIALFDNQNEPFSRPDFISQKLKRWSWRLKEYLSNNSLGNESWCFNDDLLSSEFEMDISQSSELAGKFIGSLDVLIHDINEDPNFYEKINLPVISITKDLPKKSNTKKVFVIHGHDIFLERAVGDFLIEIGLEPIILHEQVSGGSKTVIEKFIEHSKDVGFAIALFTPDDNGGKKSEVQILRSRARQNVLFELGYFIGKLGREKVVTLRKGDVEIPSDYNGVIYIDVDEGEVWKKDLIKEMSNTSMQINGNFIKTN